MEQVFKLGFDDTEDSDRWRLRAFQALPKSVHGVENNMIWLELWDVRCNWSIVLKKERRLKLNDKGLEHLVRNLTFPALP